MSNNNSSKQKNGQKITILILVLFSLVNIAILYINYSTTEKLKVSNKEIQSSIQVAKEQQKNQLADWEKLAEQKFFTSAMEKSFSKKMEKCSEDAIKKAIPYFLDNANKELKVAVTPVKEQVTKLKETQTLLTNKLQAYEDAKLNWAKEINALEHLIKTQTSWPKNIKEVQAIGARVDKLTDTIPPFTGTSKLNRLNVIEWSVLTFSAIEQANNKKIELDLRIAQLDELWRRMPDNGSHELARKLGQTINQLSVQAANLKWDKLLKRCNLYLSNKRNYPTEEQHEGLSSCISLLENYENDSKKKTIALGMKTKLKKHMLSTEHEAQIKLLKSRWENIQILKGNRSLCLVAMNELYNNLLRLKINNASQGIKSQYLDKLAGTFLTDIKKYSKKQRKYEQKKRHEIVHKYQVWAWQSIKTARKELEEKSLDKRCERIIAFINNNLNLDKKDLSAFPSIKKLIAEIKVVKTKGTMYGINISYEYNGSKFGATKLAEYVRNYVQRDIMIKYLLPINSRLLDIPLQEKYSQYWRKIWEALDSSESQTYIAEQSVNISQKSLSDFEDE